MNKFFLTNFFIFLISSISAQTLRQHIVDTLDTLDKIAQSYGVLEEDIIELNPPNSLFIMETKDVRIVRLTGFTKQRIYNLALLDILIFLSKEGLKSQDKALRAL